jgi:hypothetical protein
MASPKRSRVKVALLILVCCALGYALVVKLREDRMARERDLVNFETAGKGAREGFEKGKDLVKEGLDKTKEAARVGLEKGKEATKEGLEKTQEAASEFKKGWQEGAKK